MALPLWMLKDLKITRNQKLGLAFIFSVASFCVAVDIIRTVEAVARREAFYTILEINIVVLISCLPTYRALFNIGKQRTSDRPSKLSTWTTIENGPSGGSKEENGTALKANAIHVTNGYIVSNEERGPYPVQPLGSTSRDFILPEPAHAHPPKSTGLPPYCSPV